MNLKAEKSALEPMQQTSVMGSSKIATATNVAAVILIAEVLHAGKS